jgi:hypothetical protein
VRRSAQQQLTLDEWKAMQRQQPKANFDLRRPGEGCAVDPVWTQMRALDKKDHEVDQTVIAVFTLTSSFFSLLVVGMKVVGSQNW